MPSASIAVGACVALCLLFLVGTLGFITVTAPQSEDQTWPLSETWDKLNKLLSTDELEGPMLLRLDGRLSGSFTLNIEAGDDILFHMDVRQTDHIVVFNSFIEKEWGHEIDRRLWYGSAFSVVLTLISPSKIRLHLQSVSEDYVDWLTFECPSTNGLSFANMERLHLQCRHAPDCIAIRTLEIGGASVPTTSFKADKLPRSLALKQKTHHELKPDGKVRLFIGVLSAPSNHRRRMAIRESWWQEPAILSGEVAVRFFVAHTEDQDEQMQNVLEQATFGDLEILNFTDDYYKITRKTQRILEMTVFNTSAKYMLKCDDDSYVFVEKVLLELNHHDEEKEPYLYMGTISSDANPIRDQKNQWYMPSEDFSAGKYPPFAHGPGYILSRPLVEKCLQMWADPEESVHLPLLRLEDISVAVWVDHLHQSHNVSVTYRHDNRFLIVGCEEHCLVGHYISAERMSCIWGRYSTQQKGYCCR